jgi:hypothetical protein
MSSDKDDRDIEIIPPGQSRERGREEWIHVSFGDGAKSFRDLPLRQRILLGAAWLVGIVVIGVILFLILASAILIWIPLLLATAAITALVLFFRAKFGRK